MLTTQTRTEATTPAPSPQPPTPVKDLRDWLRRVEGLGELQRVQAPVDPIEEMGAITYLVAKQTPSPAILFENPKGYRDVKLLWNVLGPSFRRVALTVEEPPDTPTLELIRRIPLDLDSPCHHVLEHATLG